MPHFVIDCSARLLEQQPEADLNLAIYECAVKSGLFDNTDIKVRVNSYQNYLVGGQSTDFVHVFAHIMQGRTEAQRAALSKAMVSKLAELLPNVAQIAMNIDEFEKATYCNRKMLQIG